jgi:CheY-like chemotaxis protein
MIDGVRVLVADDNDGIRTTTAMILESVGCTVVEAEDGQVALEELRSQPFDVAVLDGRMSIRDGVSDVENLHPEPPPPGVVMTSAYPFENELRARLGTRVFRYLNSPCSSERSH